MAGSNSAINLGNGSAGQLVRTTGTAFEYTTATYPKTAGTSGNVLTSDGTNFVSSPAAGGLSSLVTTPEFFDDFVWNSTITNSIGELGWSSSAASTGLVINRFVSTNPGVCELSTGAGSTARVAINGTSNDVSCGSGVLTFTTSVILPTLSDGTDTYKVFIGLYSLTTMATSGKGVYFTYTNGENSGHWTLNTSNNAGSNTTADSGVAASTSWVKLSFVVNAAATSVEFFINGSSVGTIVATIPQTTDAISPFFGIIKSAGTNIRVLQVDYFYMKYALTSAR